MSRASNLAGFITAISPTTDLNVGVLTAVSFDLGGTISFESIAATDNISVGGTVAGVTTITGTGINQPLGINTLGQTEFKGAVEFNDNVSSLTVAGVTTINSDGVQSTGIGTFNKVAIGTDTPVELQTYLTVGEISQPSGWSRGGVAIKALADGVDRDSNIYLEEKVGGEGWYIGVNTEGSLNFYNSDDLIPSVFIQDSNNNVGLGSTLPTVSVDISEKTDAVALPVGTTAQRPSTAYGGYIRWNSTSSALEVYNGTNWVEIISDYFPSGSTTLG